MEAPKETKREKIVAEILRRLDIGIPLHPSSRDKILVERGYDGIDINQMPKIVVFEDTETIIEAQRGLYQKTLPIQMEYFRSLSSEREIFIQGNRMIAEVTQALELDELFHTGAVVNCPSRTGSGLVRSYGLVRNDIIELTDHRALVLVWYEFTYWECRTGVSSQCRD